MADLLPSPPTPAGLRWRRDWQRYDDYRVVHERRLDAMVAEGLTVSHSLRFVAYYDERGDLSSVNLVGRAQTHSGGTVVVNKWLEAALRYGHLAVRTSEYD